MRKKPLKISWRNWCLYKLAKRDYSAHEMRQAILKRAGESEEEIDPDPIVAKLVEEKLIDDDRYIESQIRLHTGSYNIKGPKQIRIKLSQKGGIPEQLLDRFIDESDRSWFELAKTVVDKILQEKRGQETVPQQVTYKELQKLKQKLYQKGFGNSHIEAALQGLTIVKDKPKPVRDGEIERWVDQRLSSGKGPRDIEVFLRNKGVASDLIQQHLDLPEEVWIDAARNALESKFDLNGKFSGKEKRKLFDYLARRGFSMDQVRSALQQI